MFYTCYLLFLWFKKVPFWLLNIKCTLMDFDNGIHNHLPEAKVKHNRLGARALGNFCL